MPDIEVVLQPRHGVGELIDEYAEGRLSYRELGAAISRLGYSTTSLYEMVRHITPARAALTPEDRG